MRKNEIVTLDITDITNLGFGVGRREGAVVFVSGAVPGDAVEARIIKVNSSYCVARVERYIKKSADRDDSRCRIGGCRACAYKELSYEAEARIKEAAVKQEFTKAGLSSIEIHTLTRSPKALEYRNKAQYPLCRDKDGRIKIGFFSPRTHNVCEAANCPLTPSVFGDILNTVREFLEEKQIDIYDEQSHTGLVRHIYLRRSAALGEVLLCLVINGTALPYADVLVKRITVAFPEICGIMLNINKEKTNVILGKEYKTLWGVDYITDTLAGVKLKITAPAFYQVNHGTAELIYAKARELAAIEKGDTLLDLYCGAGSIGLSMAKDAKELIGIEIVEDAVECAKYNAEANGIKNAKFFTGDATDTEKLLEAAESELGKIKPDVIILDPPRAGCDEKLLRFIVSLNPRRIVYISCNPSTLARDVKLMLELGYLASEVTPMDMFPMTGHVESVVALTRRLDN